MDRTTAVLRGPLMMNDRWRFIVFVGIGLLYSESCGPVSHRDVRQVEFEGVTSVSAQARAAAVCFDDWVVDKLRVDLKARDLTWQFQYYGADGRPGTADDLWSEGELCLPVAVPIEAEITSDTYICSWVVPALHMRKNAVPGIVFPWSFRVDRLGRFTVERDGLCGAPLFRNGPPTVVAVVSREEFLRWYHRRWQEQISRPAAH